MIWQLLKVDAATRRRLPSPLPTAFHFLNSDLTSPLLFKIDTTSFTHAYLLLGAYPSRFGHDLSLYLATANLFFGRTSGERVIRIPPASQDAKKRLAEDMGVAVASHFVVDAFGVDWRSIAQIPVNNNLAKKRPDFEGFTRSHGRILYECKGTTIAGRIEKLLSGAMEQVKGYPEDAEQKLAIVSFFSADPRMFDSATFVVDPAMPDAVLPDETTAVLLHYEKVLQFVGFHQSANEYVKVLRRMLREEYRASLEDVQADAAPPRGYDLFANTLRAEAERSERRSLGNAQFVGRRLRRPTKDRVPNIFVGLRSDMVDRLANIFELRDLPRFEVAVSGNISFFSDGTVTEIQPSSP